MGCSEWVIYGVYVCMCGGWDAVSGGCSVQGECVYRVYVQDVCADGCV